jgi:hypothetical protein
MKHIKNFLKQTYKPQTFLYYNNKYSIKIQLPTLNEQPLIEYLNNNNIKFNLEHPEYIQHNFFFYSNQTSITIQK